MHCVTDELERLGYPVGTFQLGQQVYRKKIQTHRFWIRKKCDLCGSSGKVQIKNGTYTCPVCQGKQEMYAVDEWIPDDTKVIVKSIATFTNQHGSFQIYASDSSGCGYLIQKNDDGSNQYYSSIEKVQAVCDEYNKKHYVYAKLEEYERIQIREQTGY